MKIKSLLLCFCAVILAFVTGCASKGKTNKEVASEFDEFKNSLPPAEWVEVGMPALDSVGALSAQLYNDTYVTMMEYINAADNHRYYVMLLNDVEAVKKEAEKKNEKLDDETAVQKVLNDCAEQDKTRAEQDKLMPRVIEGYNAVQALQPANKIATLIPLIARIAETAATAKNLPNEVKAAAGNPMQAAKMVKSAQNVISQLVKTAKMANWTKDQYDRNQEFKKYMQSEKK